MRNTSFILFILGLFGEIHVRFIGSISVSELYMFIVAPVIFIVDLSKLRRNGFIPFLICVFMAIAGCVISSYVNNTRFLDAIRGFAGVYSIFAIPVVLHHYLSVNLSGLKWLILGLAISNLLTIFGFQASVEMAAAELAGDVKDTELYYIRHFGGAFSFWYRGWYMSCPTTIAAILMTLPIAQMIIFTATGRSAFMIFLVSLFMLLYVHRNVYRMGRLKKKIVWLGCIGIFVIFLCTSIYKYAGSSGLLNEGATRKYEAQSRRGSGPIALIMSGRADFFAGLMACCDRPFVGFGPWAVDDGHYWRRYLQRYGDAEDFDKFQGEQLYRQHMGEFRTLIPAHSHIVGFWLWYGILALPLWLYVLKKIFEYLHRYMDAIPQWFAVLACGAPGVVWSIFFSPFGGRVQNCLYITCLLIAIAVGKGRILLPNDMQREALRIAR